MEKMIPTPVEYTETVGEKETTYVWTKEGEELAKVVAKEPESYYPQIEFVIKESVVPYYTEDKKSALDEIGEMSMYSEMETSKVDGYIHGSMKCSHNASLGVHGFVTSIKGWISKI